MEVRTPVRPSFLKKLLSIFLSLAMVLCYFVVVPVQEAKADEAEFVPKDVALGGLHSAAIMTDGSLWMWGGGGRYEIGGDSAHLDQKGPFYKLMDNVVTVALGGAHTAAITTDGSLWMWGYNYYGQLTNEVSTYSFTSCATYPQKVMDNVVSVSLGENHSAAIKNDGSLWTWGCNEKGQLGDARDNYYDCSVPQKVLDNVVSVSLGENHSAAIKNDGSLWTWGCNENGQLGDGSTEDRSEPQIVMNGVASISLGSEHSAAIKNDGSLWTWGCNYSGELGATSNDSEYSYSSFRSDPSKIMNGVVKVYLGNTRSAVIKTDGSLWTWGNDHRPDELGGSPVNQSVPIHYMDNVTSVSLGDSHWAVIKTDGSLWTWGLNWYGQLGDGTTTHRDAPVKIIPMGDTEEPEANFSGDVLVSFQSKIANQIDGKTESMSCNYNVEWDDNWFLNDSGEYNGKLSLASIALATAAYNNKESNEYRYITSSLGKLGFSAIDTSSYINRVYSTDSDYNTTKDLVAYAFGHKTIYEPNGQPRDLVAVIVRGTPTNIEWESNANIADSSTEEELESISRHEGFDHAAKELENALKAYCEEVCTDISTAKYYTTGHSRGAAVANIVAADLNTGTVFPGLGKSRVYAYTFATPATTHDLRAEGNSYSNIFNIVNPEDFVPRVPLRGWGFYRYGITLYLPSKSTEQKKYTTAIDRVSDYYLQNWGVTYHDYGGTAPTDKFVDDVLGIADSVSSVYNKKHTAGFSESAFKKLSLAAPSLDLDTVGKPAFNSITFNQYFKALTTYLANPSNENRTRVINYSVGSYVNVLSYFVLHQVAGSIAHTPKGSEAVYAHTMETYLTWLQVADEMGFSLIKQGERCDTKMVILYCPVDVEVTDPNGKVVARIVNDVVDKSVAMQIDSLAVYVDEETGAKTVWIPAEEGYRLKTTATDKGLLDIVCANTTPEGDVVDQVAYNDLNLVNGCVYTGTMAEQSNDAVILEVADENNNTLSPSYEVEDEDAFDVGVIVEGAGDALGVSDVTKGTHVTIRAYPAIEAFFVGWFDEDGVLASTDEAYTFRCEADRTFTAVFHTHTWDSGVVTTEPTNTSEGVKTYTCTGCQATKTEPIAKLNPPSSGGGGGSGFAPTPTPDPEPELTPDPVEPVRMDTGTTLEVGGISFTVLADNKTVSVKAASGSFDGKTLTIPAVVKDANGFEYQVTEVAANAFKGNTSIKQVVISEGVKVIGAYAFKGCTKLEKVTLPKSLTTIERSVFSGCKKLTKLTIPANVKSIGKYAFYKSGIKTLTIKSTKLIQKGLSPKALAGSSIKTVKVPENKLKAYKKLFTKGGCGKTVMLHKL